MDIELFRIIGAPLLAAVVGGLLVHFGARRRDRENHRRHQRIDYLVEAYRALARSSQRDLSGKHGEEFENAVDDILLLGDQEQIELSRRMMESFAANGNASLDTLLVSLRRALRRELGQSPSSLGAVPSIRVASITPDAVAPSVSDRAEVRFRAEAAKTAQAVVEAVNEVASSNALKEKPDSLAAGDSQGEPIDAIDEGYARVVEALRAKFPHQLQTDSGIAELSALAKAAAAEGLVAEPFVRLAEGLDVLKALSHDGKASMITSQHADEYLSLVSAALYVISATD